jgi:ribulose-phosphate 3-epimerase
LLERNTGRTSLIERATVGHRGNYISMRTKIPLLVDASLWSADLVNLAAEIESVAPYSDSFHIDVADGHFAPTLLFFPAMVAAIRAVTAKPLHVHLMVSDPAALVTPFIEAGADIVTVQIEANTALNALKMISSAGRKPGLALLLDTPVAALRDHLAEVEVVVAMGTQVGIRGVDLAPEACERIVAIRKLIGGQSKAKLYADGGIREHTVPKLRHAGADAVVPGSLLFNSPDRRRVHEWLKAL